MWLEEAKRWRLKSNSMEGDMYKLPLSRLAYSYSSLMLHSTCMR